MELEVSSKEARPRRRRGRRLLPFDYAVRNLGRSPVRLGLSVAGSMLVVLLVLAAGGFVRGMVRSLGVSGEPDNVILVSAGSEESMERSEILELVHGLVQSHDLGVRSRLGVPYISPEIHVQTPVRESRDAPEAPMALIRGVEPAAFLVHPAAHVVEGRLPESGRDEILVGALAAAKLGLAPERLAIGQKLWIEDRHWTIAGRFDAPGTVMAAEVWMPLRDAQIVTQRQGKLSCVVLTLDSAAGATFADVDVFVRQQPAYELVALRERDYYAKLGAFFRPIAAMVWATAGLIALGGLLGGLNTMYAAFASRVREMGTLQSIGFSRTAIAVSLMQESLLAAAAGALVAAGIGLLVLDGLTVRFSMGVFGLTVDSAVLALGLAAGAVLGIIGAMPPAWRCLRLPITEALKAA